MGVRARDNPFASERIAENLPFDPKWLGLTWSELMTSLQKHDYRAAVVGAHGSGKTTFLQALKLRLENQGYWVESIFLNEEQTSLSETVWRRLAELEGQTELSVIVLLDGAEQMSWRQWRRFSSLTEHYQGLVITQHKEGKLPVLLKTEVNFKMFISFVKRLSPGWGFDDEVLEGIFNQAQGNVREALWVCYDLLAEGSGRTSG